MKTKLFSLLSILIIFNILINNINCEPKKKHKSKKHKKQSTKKLMKNGLPYPDSVRPNFIPPELFCESCRAIVKEALKELKTKTKETDVIYYLNNNVCDQKRYSSYQFVPPDMKAGCAIFIDYYEEALIKVLTKRKVESTKEELVQELCYNVTTVCEGVEVNNFKNMKKIEKNMEINGEKINIEYKPTKKEENIKKVNKKNRKKNNDL